jgi:hypothetical protein
MWVAFFLTALVFAVVWLAAVLLAIRDRYRSACAPPLDQPDADRLATEADILPCWKRVLRVPLAILFGPGVVLVVSILVAPLLVVQLVFFAYHGLRLKLLGIPMPRAGPPEDS